MTGPSKVGDVVTPPGPWTTSGPLSRGCTLQPEGLCSPFFAGTFWTPGRTNIAGSLDSEKWHDVPGFTDFRPVLFVTKCHTENSLQLSHLCPLFFWQNSFSRFFHDHRWGSEQRPIYKLAALQCLKAPVLSPPCINLFVPTSVTREYHPKVLERLHLLQCISAHLQTTLTWASWETQYLNLFSANFCSCLVSRSRKPIKCVLQALLRRYTHAVPIRPPQKENGSSCISQQWHPRRSVSDCLSQLCPARGPHVAQSKVLCGPV